MNNHYEQEMYEFFKNQDYSEVTDYLYLFSDTKSYLRALSDRKHYFHKEAVQIRDNRMKDRRDYERSDADKRWSDGYEHQRELIAIGEY